MALSQNLQENNMYIEINKGIATIGQRFLNYLLLSSF